MTTQHPDGTIEFRFYRPKVHRVALVGDFNGWDEGVTQMNSAGDGWWVGYIRMEPGVYQFRYRADANWFLDYASFGLERGPFGWNSVLCVDAKSGRGGYEIAAGELPSATSVNSA